MGRVIYLDYHSTTPCDPRVVDTMSPYFSDIFGNPSSQHKCGRQAKDGVEKARRQLAAAIGSLPGEVVFTSGATESNNIALLGIAPRLRSHGQILVSSLEHKSVLNSASALSKSGYTVREIPCDGSGKVDVGWLETNLSRDTVLVAVQSANNELGTIQPIREISDITRSFNAHFHCDAAQSLDRMPVDVKEWGVDSASFSAHKAYGPKGIGGLYLKGGAGRWSGARIHHGGGQEARVRPGTQNVPGIVGFGRACELVESGTSDGTSSYRELRDLLEKGITSNLDDVEIIGDTDDRLPTTSNLRFVGVEAEAVLARLENIMLSSGSACEAGAPEPSHVLQEIGLSREAAYECIRMAVGRYTTREDVECAVQEIGDAVRTTRAAMRGATA